MESLMAEFIKHDEINGWSDTDSFVLECPVCGMKNTHFGDPVVKETDDYEAWDGRGKALRIPCYCENGHAFTIGLGFHKGNTVTFWERRKEAEPKGEMAMLDEDDLLALN